METQSPSPNANKWRTGFSIRNPQSYLDPKYLKSWPNAFKREHKKPLLYIRFASSFKRELQKIRGPTIDPKTIVGFYLL